MENRLNLAEDELAAARFKLQKAQDIEVRNEDLFKSNQNLENELDHKTEENTRKQRQI